LVNGFAFFGVAGRGKSLGRGENGDYGEKHSHRQASFSYVLK
jgi:hypothetical protein